MSLQVLLSSSLVWVFLLFAEAQMYKKILSSPVYIKNRFLLNIWLLQTCISQVFSIGGIVEEPLYSAQDNLVSS